MEKKIVVALIGAGRAGREHATNLGSLPDVRVALVCDPVTAAAQNAGKLARADKITESVDEVFDRRFDPGHAEVKRQLDAGALGQIDQFLSVSRDPAPPSKEYMAKSGGLLIDSAIHDFDIARFFVGEVEEVICWGSVRFCEYAGEVGDVDTATTLLKFKNGAQGVVQNCRRAACRLASNCVAILTSSKYRFESN